MTSEGVHLEIASTSQPNRSIQAQNSINRSVQARRNPRAPPWLVESRDPDTNALDPKSRCKHRSTEYDARI